MKESPLLIVLTPVRNEAWVLRAFLSATSLWADLIIIADQMSTDGSREIYQEFPKVHVVDNTNPYMHQAAARRLLFKETQRILNGNTNAVLLALDADEILAGDFLHTKAWKTLLSSEPNDCFEWRWMNLKIGDATKYSLSGAFHWGVHVSDTLWNGYFPERNIHEWRLPWPDPCHSEYIFEDLFSIHFAQLNVPRLQNKWRFYQVNSLPNTKRYNAITLYRQYHTNQPAQYQSLPVNAFSYYGQNGIDILNLINLHDEGQHYTNEVKACFDKNGIGKYAVLDIWDKGWCEHNHIVPPKRTAIQTILLWYLEKTNKYAHRKVVKITDKILKLFFAH